MATGKFQDEAVRLSKNFSGDFDKPLKAWLKTSSGAAFTKTLPLPFRSRKSPSSPASTLTRALSSESMSDDHVAAFDETDESNEEI